MNIGLGRRTAQKRVTGGRWRRIVLGGVLAGRQGGNSGLGRVACLLTSNMGRGENDTVRWGVIIAVNALDIVKMIPRNNLATKIDGSAECYMRYRLASDPLVYSFASTSPWMRRCRARHMPEPRYESTSPPAGTAPAGHLLLRRACRAGQARVRPLGRRAPQRGVLPHLSLKSSRLARSCSSSFAFSWLRAAEAQRQVRGARGEGRGARGEGRGAVGEA